MRSLSQRPRLCSAFNVALSHLVLMHGGVVLQNQCTHAAEQCCLLQCSVSQYISLTEESLCIVKDKLVSLTGADNQFLWCHLFSVERKAYWSLSHHGVAKWKTPRNICKQNSSTYSKHEVVYSHAANSKCETNTFQPWWFTAHACTLRPCALARLCPLAAVTAALLLIVQLLLPCKQRRIESGWILIYIAYRKLACTTASGYATTYRKAIESIFRIPASILFR